ncbi:MAG: ankyrin repeat domain-containing protein [Pyrinomonadaceae bacterium]
MNLPGNNVTELMIAASRGELSRVEALLGAGASVDAQDLFGNTALTYAAGAGHTDVVATLVMAGADVTHSNRTGRTALHVASDRGYPATAQMLRQAHLCCAARDGQLALIEEVLVAGADVNAQLADGWTALMIAVYHDQPAAVQLLLMRGANAEQQTVTGRSARTIAAGLSHQECYRLLTQPDAPQPLPDAPLPLDVTATISDVTDFADAEHPDN